MEIDVITIIIQLLNISLDFEKMSIPDNIRLLIRKKPRIMRCMAIKALNLLKQIDGSKNRNKINISIRIAQFYKRYRLQLMHQTYNLTREYQRKIVILPVKNHCRAFSNTFYDFKNMTLDKVDDAEGNINQVEYTPDDLKIPEGFNPILETNTLY